jgi:8-oxo-dGTP diphosphatase
MGKPRRDTMTEREEQQFLAAYDASKFPHPSVSVDVALVTADEGRLRALLIERSEHPHRGRWSLPGGFVQIDESLDAAAARVLETKAGVTGIFLEQLYTFGEPDRDPRTRVISVAYYALVDTAKLTVQRAADNRVELATLHVPWPGERGGPVDALNGQGSALPLAFDHADILGLVVKRLRGKLDYAPLGFELLPKKFTLRQLQAIHETILGRRLNKDSFRRRMLASGLVAATGEREAEVGHRPAERYRFHRKKSGRNG